MGWATVAATLSATQASCATGLPNRSASGLLMNHRLSTFHMG